MGIEQIAFNGVGKANAVRWDDDDLGLRHDPSNVGIRLIGAFERLFVGEKYLRVRHGDHVIVKRPGGNGHFGLLYEQGSGRIKPVRTGDGL